MSAGSDLCVPGYSFQRTTYKCCSGLTPPETVRDFHLHCVRLGVRYICLRVFFVKGLPARTTYDVSFGLPLWEYGWVRLRR